MSITVDKSKGGPGRWTVLLGLRRRRVGGWRLAVVLAGTLLASTSHAQRGEGFEQYDALASAPNASRGFPSLLDTQLVKEGALVAEAPTLSVYYGATSKLTIGTSLVASFAPFVVGGEPSGAGHARYLLHSESWYRSTIEALLVGASTGESLVSVGLIGAKVEFVPMRSHRVGLQGWVGQADIRADELSSKGLATIAGASYSYLAADWIAFHLSSLYLGSLTGNVERETASIDANFTAGLSAAERWVYRAQVALRAGRWLFEANALGGPNFGPVPWLGVSCEFGG